MRGIQFLFLVYAMLSVVDGLAQTDSSFIDKSGIYTALRLGVGLEKSPYFEMGLSRIGINDKTWAGSFCFYAAGQLNVLSREQDAWHVYGGKIGFETAWMIGMWGAEIKYLTNNKQSQIYFTPKVGISALGFASILYGYNTPKRDKLEEIGTHQVSITLNWSKKLVRYFK